MLQTIIDFFNIIVDAINTAFSFLVSYVMDLIKIVSGLAKSLLTIPTILSFLPTIILTTVIGCFTLIMILRVSGRD